MGRAARPVSGRAVAVTGAARGIGRATAEALAREGAKVAIGDLDEELAETAAREIGAGATGHALDVTDPDSYARFLDAAEEAHGPLGVLVNNAGVMFVGPFLDGGARSDSKMMDVNFHGTAIGMRLAIPRMRERGGHIVNLTSSASYVCPPGEAVYAASKHASRALSEALRAELGDVPIDISVVMPGIVDTELARGTNLTRGGKMIAPSEVADAIVATVRRPRHEVFVPKANGPLVHFYAWLPPRGRLFIGRAFGIDKVATGVDPESRAAYERRMAGSDA
jgi:NAD(P)-dependent dehydrogenase (short-subunit alcohol dehydrogenase family)